jgi:hypothetical protein
MVVKKLLDLFFATSLSEICDVIKVAVKLFLLLTCTTIPASQDNLVNHQYFVNFVINLAVTYCEYVAGGTVITYFCKITLRSRNLGFFIL